MEEEIKIHQHKGLAVFTILGGVFVAVTAAMIGGSRWQVALGPIIVLTGIAQLASPNIIITETEIQMKNVFGMTLKRVPYNANNTEMRENALYVDNKKVRIGIGGLMHQPDVRKAVVYFESLSKANQSTEV